MNKKVWIGFIVIYIFTQIADYVIHGVLLGSYYQSLMSQFSGLYRPEGEGKIWIFFVTNLFYSYFFVFIFSKGYEGKGIGEGLRYGLYIALMTALPAAYAEYAIHPVPYSMTIQWFIYDLVKLLIAGAIASMIFGSKQKEPVPA